MMNTESAEKALVREAIVGIRESYQLTRALINRATF